jgi:hypothetical protein
MAYMLNAWGLAWYASNPANPAVYVFVRDGEHTVTVLPCSGGSNSANGKHWTINKPGWPTRPSLPDVTRATAPAPQTAPASNPTGAIGGQRDDSPYTSAGLREAKGH